MGTSDEQQHASNFSLIIEHSQRALQKNRIQLRYYVTVSSELTGMSRHEVFEA